MAEKQTIPVIVEAGLLKQVEAIAARRGRTVSELLADRLRDLVAEDSAYEIARRRAKDLMQTGLDLQSGRMQDRNETHRRRP